MTDRTAAMHQPVAEPLPLLYTFRRCPYAIRARMAMLQAGRTFRAFEVVLRDKPAELLALSPEATVPVLKLPDGHVLTQSWDIVAWAFENDDREGWWARAQCADNLALLHCNDGAFKRQLDRYKYPQRFGADTGSREAPRARAVAELLRPLEARLQRCPYLGGQAPCASDLAIFPFVRQFAGVEPDWFAAQALPALQVWLLRWLDSELFDTCMTRLPLRQVTEFPVLDRTCDPLGLHACDPVTNLPSRAGN